MPHGSSRSRSETLVITPLVCSLVGQRQSVQIQPGTHASSLYRSSEAIEDYFCNYGVNPAYRRRLEEAV